MFRLTIRYDYGELEVHLHSVTIISFGQPCVANEITELTFMFLEPLWLSQIQISPDLFSVRKHLQYKMFKYFDMFTLSKTGCVCVQKCVLTILHRNCLPTRGADNGLIKGKAVLSAPLASLVFIHMPCCLLTKVFEAYVVTFLSWTPIFEWYITRLEDKEDIKKTFKMTRLD